MRELTVADTRVAVAGGEMAARVWTPTRLRHSAPLVMLHDSLGSTEQWRELPQILAFRLERPIIAYDRLGFGQSSPRDQLPSPHFVEEEATIYFPALQQQLGVTDFALFGHSVGGGMSLAIAAHHAVHCRAVISESAQAFVEDRTAKGIRAAERAFAVPETFQKLAKWHGDKSRWVLDAWTKVWLSAEFKDWSVDSFLARVTCPVLAIHGDNDEYGSVAFPERIAAGVQGPSELHILEGCGHVPHRERQDEVVALVADFLARLK